MGYSIRIKLKSVEHFRRCVLSLKECGVEFYTDDEDELTMHRVGEYGWLYVGINKVAWVFFNKSVVKYAKPMKLKDVVKLYQQGCICCPTSTD